MTLGGSGEQGKIHGRAEWVETETGRRGAETLTVATRIRGVPLGMSRIRPEYLNTQPSDRSVAADVLLRQEPDEEEDDGKEEDDDDDDKDDDGYSEWACA